MSLEAKVEALRRLVDEISEELREIKKYKTSVVDPLRTKRIERTKICRRHKGNQPVKKTIATGTLQEQATAM